MNPAERAARPSSRTGLPKALAVVVVVAILAAGGFAINRAVVSEVNGASSASESVEDFLNALEDKDWTRLGLLLPPDETFQLAELLGDVEAVQRKAGSASDTVDDQLDGVEIAISIDGPTVGYSFTSGTERDSGNDTVTLRGDEQSPFLMSVRRDGSWFVSPMFTAAQYLAEEFGWETVDSGPSGVTYDSPQAAADGFLDGLIKTIETSDINHVADAMGGVESRLLKTYAAGINDELGSGADFGFADEVAVEIGDTDHSVSPGENGQARITVERIGATVTDDEDDAVVIGFDGDCLSTESGTGSDKGCISDGGEFATGLYSALGHLVAVPADGGWKISLVATYFDWIGIIRDEIAGLDVDLLKALTQMDFSAVAQREPAADLRPDDEVVVDVAPLSDAIGAGIAVLEPTPSGDPVDFSCSAEAVAGFCEILVVDADGRIQDRASAHDPDHDDGPGYGSGYEVTGGTRVIVLAVAGKVSVESER